MTTVTCGPRFAAVSELDGIDEPLTLVRRHGLHGGSDIIAWRDLRRVIEKAQRTAGDAHFAAHLREQRAVTSAGLARSQALFGTRTELCAPWRRAHRTRGATCNGGGSPRMRRRGHLHRRSCAVRCARWRTWDAVPPA